MNYQQNSFNCPDSAVVQIPLKITVYLHRDCDHHQNRLRWWLFGRVPDLQSVGCRFESRPGLLRTKVYSAFYPSWVGKWVPAAAGKAKAGMAHCDCGWTCGCAGKTVKSLENTCHTWALLRWCFTTRRHNEVYLYLTYSISSISGLVAKATGLHSTSLGSTAAGIDMSLWHSRCYAHDGKSSGRAGMVPLKSSVTRKWHDRRINNYLFLIYVSAPTVRTRLTASWHAERRLKPGNVHMCFSSRSGYRPFITPPLP